jgi:Fur family transcriptional regulator, stress-responsive regulator
MVGVAADRAQLIDTELIDTEPIDPAELIRQRGFKVTTQRLAVLRAVTSRPHLTADEVFDVVRSDVGAISRRSVYDAVTFLAEIGLLRRIQPAGSPARYEDRVGDNHHHLICRACGRTVDVDCAVGSRPCLTAADGAGFEIDEAEVIYWGRCPACREAGVAVPASDRARPNASNTTSNITRNNIHRGET